MESYFIRIDGIGESSLQVENIDTANLLDNEAIIKIDYTMISSGTELSRAYGLKRGVKYPVRVGYCAVGKIIEAGSALDLKPGDIVFCDSDHASVARRKRSNIGQGDMIVKVPEGIDEKWVPALNLMLIALQGVNSTSVKLNDTIGVYGLGNVGLLAALMYQKMGCKVIGLDPVESRCKLAQEMGLKYVISANEQKPEIDKLTDNKGFDIAVDATGACPVIIECIKHTKKYGQVLLLGSPRVSYQADIMPIFSDIHMKNLKVLGGLNATAPFLPVNGSNNSIIKNIETAFNLMKNKDIDVAKLISKVVDPKESKAAYYDCMYNKENTNLVIFDWTKY